MVKIYLLWRYLGILKSMGADDEILFIVEVFLGILKSKGADDENFGATFPSLEESFLKFQKLSAEQKHAAALR